MTSNALEWKNGEARSSLGHHYSLQALRPNIWVTSINGTEVNDWKSTEDLAKAIAQNHHERAIERAMKETTSIHIKDNVDFSQLEAELRKRADHAGILLVDPPRPHPDADLLRRAADALSLFHQDVSPEGIRHIYRETTPDAGLIRLHHWPEGYVLWYHGEIVWRSWGPKAERPSEAPPKVETGRQVTLAECPVGLFRWGGELCLKTEYGDNSGRIHAYIVSSGESFWGCSSNIDDQRKVMVEPVQEIGVEPARGPFNHAEQLRAIEKVLSIPSAGHASAGELAETILDALEALDNLPKAFTVGDVTMRKAFEPAGIRNLHDLQAVLDAVEAALAPAPQAESSEIVNMGISQFADNSDEFELLINFADGREPGFMMRRDAVERAATEFARLVDLSPALQAEERAIESRREQEAFEAWAKESRYVLDQHPLHYLFLDKKTDAARHGWKAALQFVRDNHIAPQPLPMVPQLGGAPEDLRNAICAVIELFGIDGVSKVTEYTLKHRGVNAFDGKPIAPHQPKGDGWMPIETAPAGIEIMTKIDDEQGERNVQSMTKRILASGKFQFWYPDGSGYVYYEPTHWRPMSAEGASK